MIDKEDSIEQEIEERIEEAITDHLLDEFGIDDGELRDEF
jgi:hypothetical protein